VALDVVGVTGFGIAFLCTNHARNARINISQNHAATLLRENGSGRIGGTGPGTASLLRMDRF
jgi:hypothetical protein